MTKVPHVKLSDIADINPRLAERVSDDTVVSFVRMANLNAVDGDVVAEERPYYSVRKGFTPFRDGDVLVAKITPCFENGKIAQAKLSNPLGFGSTEFHVVRAKRDHSEPRYLLHYLRLQSVRNAGELSMTGSAGQKRVPLHFLTNLVLPLPPLPDQRRVVAVLDRAEELRAKRRQVMAQLDSLSQAIFLDMFGDPIRVGAQWNWDIVAVGTAGRVQLGRQRAPKYQSGRHTRPYLRVANVYEDRIDLTSLLSMDFDADDEAAYQLKPDDILLNEGQSTELVGRPAMWSGELEVCCFQNTLIRFQADRRTTNPVFALGVFLYYFRAGAFAKISSKTSSVAHLGASRFGAMSFPMPPMRLQVEFARRMTSVKKMKRASQSALMQLDNLFASIQCDAFRGEL